MQKQSMWASAALGALWLALAASPATAQEGRPAGSDQRGQAAPAAKPQQGEPRPADRPKEGERAQPAERAPTDRAPQGQPPRDAQTDRPAGERAQGPPTDVPRGVGPADHLAQIETKHAMHVARIEKLMEVFRAKGDKEKLLELEQMRDRELNKYQKALAGLEREVGAERYRAARAAFNEKHGKPVPSERGAEIRTERAAAEEKARGETDAATQRAEQARKEQARKQQTQKGQTDRPADKPAPPAGGKPADKPADKPERERDGGAS